MPYVSGEARSPLDDLIFALCFGDGAEELMTFFIYFDDSGTHPSASTAVAACWVSTAEMWTKCQQRWDVVCKEEGIEDFHTAEFASSASNSRFNAWPEKEKIRVLDRLCDLIDSSVYAGFGYGLTKKDFDELISPVWRQVHFGERHYTFALRSCIGLMRKWKTRFYPNDPVHYIFDQMAEGKEEIVKVMNEAISQKGDLKATAFSSRKNIAPLLAADILAWGTFQSMRFLVDGRQMSHIAHHLVKRFESFTAFHSVVSASRDKLAEWVDLEKEEFIRRLPADELEAKV